MLASTPMSSATVTAWRDVQQFGLWKITTSDMTSKVAPSERSMDWAML